MRKVFDVGFRQVYRRVCLLHFNAASLGLVDGALWDPLADATLAYGFIDEVQGLSFELLAPVNTAKGTFAPQMDPMRFGKRLAVCAEWVANEAVSPVGDKVEKFFAQRAGIIDTEHVIDPGLERARQDEGVDKLRDPYFPDQVRVHLLVGTGFDDETAFGPKGRVEEQQLWVNLEDVQHGKLQALLLTEPFLDCGLHAGDQVPLQRVETSRGVELQLCIRRTPSEPDPGEPLCFDGEVESFDNVFRVYPVLNATAEQGLPNVHQLAAAARRGRRRPLKSRRRTRV